MTRHAADPVELFLEDLGAAPVPAGLSGGVVDRVAREGGARAPRRRLEHVLVAALVAIAAVAAALVAGGPLRVVPPVSPEPSVSPSPSASPTAAESASPSPLGTASPSPTPSATASPAPPTPSPRPSFEARGRWELELERPLEEPFRLRVVDFSGRLVDAVATEWEPGLMEDAPGAVSSVWVDDGMRRIIVGWGLLSCVPRGQLEVAPDARSLELRVPPTPGCDAIGPQYAVILDFRDGLDAGVLSGPITKSLVTPADVIPHSVAFAGAATGWVGGTTPEGDAILLETLDGAGSWTVWGFLDGTITEIAASAPRAAFGGTCLEGDTGCYIDNTLLRAPGDEQPYNYVTEHAAAIDYAGNSRMAPPNAWSRFAVGVFRDGEASVLRLSDDGGETWTDIESPCSESEQLVDAARPDDRQVLVLCVGAAPEGASLYRTDADGGGGISVPRRAAPVAATDIDFAPDGSGWAWGPDTALYATAEAEGWQQLDVADGVGRRVVDATYLGDGAGFLLLVDEQRKATLLLETTDGVTWAERMAWRAAEPSGAAEVVVALRTRPPEPAGGPCMAALATGELVADERFGIGLQTGQSRYTVIWPHGYSGRANGGRVALVDSTGRLLAHVGDVVQLGGGGVEGGNAWHACGDVEVVDGRAN